MTDLDLPDSRPDVRLVVSDMDGTLLNEDGAVPDGFWPLLDLMRERGIRFVPASGRQFHMLERLFARAPEGISYIAENGSLVVHDGQFRASTTIDCVLARDVVTAVRESGRDLGLVVCGTQGGYVERHDLPFLDESDKYYLRLDRVDDLLAVDDEILKLAIYDFDDAAVAAHAHFAAFTERCQVVVSGPNWIDLMSPGVDKGIGVRMLQDELGVTPAQTVVFGDYLNDLQMLDAADWSFAVSNAHPEIRERARYGAPSNADEGVVQVLSALLDGRRPEGVVTEPE